jgi:hypothetical protein
MPKLSGRKTRKQWATAIDRLKTIDFKDPDYRQAQTLLANYEKRFSNVQIRLKTEQASTRAFKEAQQLRNYLFDSIPSNAKALSPDQARQLHRIADKLKEVKAGTTVYAEARDMLKAAEARLK